MRNDAINMEVNEGLLAFFAEEEDEESLLRGKLEWKSASALCAALAGTKPSERSVSGEKRA